jgi:hypothetical protein
MISNGFLKQRDYQRKRNMALLRISSSKLPYVLISCKLSIKLTRQAFYTAQPFPCIAPRLSDGNDQDQSNCAIHPTFLVRLVINNVDGNQHASASSPRRGRTTRGEETDPGQNRFNRSGKSILLFRPHALTTRSCISRKKMLDETHIYQLSMSEARSPPRRVQQSFV